MEPECTPIIPVIYIYTYILYPASVQEYACTYISNVALMQTEHHCEEEAAYHAENSLSSPTFSVLPYHILSSIQARPGRSVVAPKS